MVFRKSIFVTAALAAFTFAGSAQAAGDVKAGEQVFTEQCAICHSAEKGGPNKVGPALHGVIGRKAGTHPGYMFSNAMKNSGITWTDAEMASYLAAPAKKVPGTKMGFPGFSNKADEANLIAYLGTLK